MVSARRSPISSVRPESRQVLRRGPVLEREPHRLTLVEDEPRRREMIVDVERKRRAQREHVGATACGDPAVHRVEQGIHEPVLGSRRVGEDDLRLAAGAGDLRRTRTAPRRRASGRARSVRRRGRRPGPRCRSACETSSRGPSCRRCSGGSPRRRRSGGSTSDRPARRGSSRTRRGCRNGGAQPVDRTRRLTSAAEWQSDSSA